MFRILGGIGKTARNDSQADLGRIPSNGPATPSTFNKSSNAIDTCYTRGLQPRHNHARQIQRQPIDRFSLSPSQTWIKGPHWAPEWIHPTHFYSGPSNVPRSKFWSNVSHLKWQYCTFHKRGLALIYIIIDICNFNSVNRVWHLFKSSGQYWREQQRIMVCLIWHKIRI